MENLETSIVTIAESVTALVKKNRNNVAAALFLYVDPTDDVTEFAGPLLDMIQFRFSNGSLVFYIDERRIPSKDIISFLKKNYPACVFS